MAPLSHRRVGGRFHAENWSGSLVCLACQTKVKLQLNYISLPLADIIGLLMECL